MINLRQRLWGWPDGVGDYIEEDDRFELLKSVWTDIQTNDALTMPEYDKNPMKLIKSPVCFC